MTITTTHIGYFHYKKNELTRVPKCFSNKIDAFHEAGHAVYAHSIVISVNLSETHVWIPVKVYKNENDFIAERIKFYAVGAVYNN